ncbi:hypothetical protein DVH24_000030 [Malus domestica]|uniref:Uncharacterized protein n=1 Tax=Malus domestica TaxID=3750 RepID=A0A498J4N7_MALDO|nr:hypothetical protein DVH24_000030 [Malus domestica]
MSSSLPNLSSIPFALSLRIIISSSNQSFVGLLFMCPNHLNQFSLILTSTTITPTLPQISSFLIIFFLMCPHIKHTHIQYTHFLHMLLFDHPIFCAIKHRW